ncbi:import receptor subunit tom22 [Anaeramoeba ignava]|uniref:Import receptor subunit tom22 n=1 Tax=Anaeramoeba ignava TaxID=1746090 RepID=A0A9Q0L4W8_ANAIG|nr:import receptor subunit tom22 [Anaeramoeba ignava]|eukprot:Anaeramoba_ignava/a249065_33.p1 GENE.a249065_33~~a249065_33.p1  ORF type:complete len:118 (-),score=44.57 a249065_33:41-367(-)
MSKLELEEETTQKTIFEEISDFIPQNIRNKASQITTSAKSYISSGFSKIKQLSWVGLTGTIVLVLPLGVAIATEQQLQELDSIEAQRLGVDKSQIDSTAGQSFRPLFN